MENVPDTETSYALIPIRRDIVTEIDNVRDGLSRSEYIRLLFKQAQNTGLQVANEQSSRITASTGDTEATGAGSGDTTRHRSRSSDGGMTIDRDTATTTGRSTHADQTSRTPGDEVSVGAPRQTRSSPTVGSFGNIYRGTPHRNETKRTGESSPLKQDRPRSTSKRGTSSPPPQSDAKSTAGPDHRENRSRDESAFRREGTTTVTGVDRRRSRRDREKNAQLNDSRSRDRRSPESQHTRETPNEQASYTSADTQTTAHTEDGVNSTDHTNTRQMTSHQSRDTRGKRRAVEKTAKKASVLTPEWNVSLGGFMIAWALAAGIYGGGDTITTIYALASGGAVETNPIIRAAISIHPAAMLVVKLAIIGGLFKLADNAVSEMSVEFGDQIAIFIPTILTAIGGYGTFVNLQNLSGSMIPYVLLTIIFIGIAGGAAVALYKGLPLAGNKLQNYQFGKPVSSVGNESIRANRQ